MPWTLDPNREHTVLLPFDFSAPAFEAISVARGLVADVNRLFMLHVVLPVSVTSPGYVLGKIDERTLRERADTALAKAMSEAGIDAAQRRVVTGDPADSIITVAREIDANLIVIPSRGKTGVRRWMIGSVAERVVRRAPCPVLVLPIGTDQPEPSA